LHGLSQPARLNESEVVGRERFESLSEMPRAVAANAGGDLYRQHTARSAVAAGRVLERRMPHGGAWIECASEDALLIVMRNA